VQTIAAPLAMKWPRDYVCDKVTESMQMAIDETDAEKTQIDYNLANGITPKTILKSVGSILSQTKWRMPRNPETLLHRGRRKNTCCGSRRSLSQQGRVIKMIERTRKAMEKAAKELEFMEAARLRDEYLALQNLLESKK